MPIIELTSFSSILFLIIGERCDILYSLFGLIWFMLFNATFNHIYVISWMSIVLVEEIEENHGPAAGYLQTLALLFGNCSIQMIK